MQGAARTWRGAITRLIADDKGVRFLVVCGVPGFIAEDDAGRALQIATRSCAALGRLGLRCAVGVASGRMFCGTAGSQLRAEYTLLTDAHPLT